MLSEKAMLTLEANIPKLARNAFEKAYYDALTNSGRVLRAINGQLVETLARTLGVVDGIGYLRVGYHNDDAASWGSRRFFKGLIDDVRIYTGCTLTDADVSALAGGDACTPAPANAD